MAEDGHIARYAKAKAAINKGATPHYAIKAHRITIKKHQSQLIAHANAKHNPKGTYYESHTPVKKSKHAWGEKMSVGGKIHLHPLTQQRLSTLGHKKSIKFNDESGTKWNAHRHQDTIHFSEPGQQKSSHTIARKEFFSPMKIKKEEVETLIAEGFTEEEAISVAEKLQENLLKRIARKFRSTSDRLATIGRKSKTKSKKNRAIASNHMNNMVKSILKPEHHHLVRGTSQPRGVSSAAIRLGMHGKRWHGDQSHTDHDFRAEAKASPKDDADTVYRKHDEQKIHHARDIVAKAYRLPLSATTAKNEKQAIKHAKAAKKSNDIEHKHSFRPAKKDEISNKNKYKHKYMTGKSKYGLNNKSYVRKKYGLDETNEGTNQMQEQELELDEEVLAVVEWLMENDFSDDEIVDLLEKHDLETIQETIVETEESSQDQTDDNDEDDDEDETVSESTNMTVQEKYAAAISRAMEREDYSLSPTQKAKKEEDKE